MESRPSVAGTSGDIKQGIGWGWRVRVWDACQPCGWALQVRSWRGAWLGGWGPGERARPATEQRNPGSSTQQGWRRASNSPAQPRRGLCFFCPHVKTPHTRFLSTAFRHSFFCHFTLHNHHSSYAFLTPLLHFKTFLPFRHRSSIHVLQTSFSVLPPFDHSFVIGSGFGLNVFRTCFIFKQNQPW